MEGIIRFLPLFNKLESLIEKVNSDTKNQNLITRTILIHSVFFKANCKSDPFFDCTAWTGGNDLDVEGQYRWDHSNTLVNFTNWHYHEPSLGDPNQALSKDCIDMLRDGVWNDRPCSYLNSVICEKSFNN